MAEFGKKIGFIGSGNMARAIIRGMLNVGLLSASDITIADALAEQVQKVQAETGVNAASSNAELAASSDVIIIATKPHHVAGVMAEIRPALQADRHLVISICAGVRTATIEAAAGGLNLPVIRVMPNTPALIGMGSAAIAPGAYAEDGHLKLASQIFDSVGTSVVTPEEKLDAVTGVSGSGPAYVIRFMEALLQAAEDSGLSADEAKILVPQMVLGSAKMAIESDRTLAELRKAVTTPGGTTAAGLKVLEEGDFMGLISDCVAAATARSRELAAS